MRELKTMNIKGKEYVLVNERVEAFRELYGDRGAIVTEKLYETDEAVEVKASVFVDDRLAATGHAMEEKNSSYINKTSFVENCETSAVGRALGFFGIGISTSIATAEEVETAINKQETLKAAEKTISATKARAFREMIRNEGLNELFICGSLKISTIEEMTEGQHRWIFDHMDEVKRRQNEWSARH